MRDDNKPVRMKLYKYKDYYVLVDTFTVRVFRKIGKKWFFTDSCASYVPLDLLKAPEYDVLYVSNMKWRGWHIKEKRLKLYVTDNVYTYSPMGD